MSSRRWPCGLIGGLWAALALGADTNRISLRGDIRDATTGERIPARLSIQSADGSQWFFAKSADPQGSAIVYDKQRDRRSVEKHTTLSAHPFVAELPSGRYTLTVERGKEYFTTTRDIEIGTKPIEVSLPLRRWIHMAEQGWYSGDTHVHRTIAELPNVILAEDLNVVFPMSQWVTVTHTLPEKGRVDPAPIPREPIFADPRHAIVPLNTEYEIFSVGSKRHTLGAVLVLGQKEPLKLGIPPVKAVAAEAHRQGALLDLEKHSWAWTPMIAPVMQADLYPLSNNHIWRTEFAFKQWTIENNWRDNTRIETTAEGFTELGWLHFGWEQYYAMLNCGLRMRPTAGTANGVHPVSAGFSRVYVDLGSEKFTPDTWLKRLNEGHSFVTTGPMLFATIGPYKPGARIQEIDVLNGVAPRVPRIRIESQNPITKIEFIVNGNVAVSRAASSERQSDGHFVTMADGGNWNFQTEGSCWIIARCFEQTPSGRVCFAHTAPWYFDQPGREIRPRRDQVRYLMQRVEEEIARNRELLSSDELSEYQSALEFYRRQLTNAR